MPNETNRCKVLLGSITQSMRAQDILARAAIPTAVIKQEKSEGTGRGCTYGLSYSCAQASNIRAVLEYERIKVKKWMGE